MHTYAACVEYDGGCFQGFLTSGPHDNFVDTYLIKAIATVCNGEVHGFACAGRTDRGVSALGQVISFAVDGFREVSAIFWGVNKLLPPTIRLVWVKEALEGFNARYQCIARTYRYFICHGNYRSVFFPKTLFVRGKLDVASMVLASQYLLGEHDFASFRSSKCQSRSSHRFVHDIRIYAKQDNILVIEITASAFLYRMVRRLVACLLTVASGKEPPLWIKELRDAKDPLVHPQAVDARGLVFCQAHYPLRYGFEAPGYAL